MSGILGRVSFSGAAVAELLFFVVAAFTVAMSLILFFHWRKYGMGGPAVAVTEFIYAGVSLALLAAAFLSIN